MTRPVAAAFAAGIACAAAAPAAAADKHYAPGITDTTITIGQTNPYSGPVSANGSNGIGDQAYVRWINDQGGVNGRKINLISLDDAYTPPRTLEQTRKLVEQDGVAFIYRSLGTAPNMAIAKYLNDRKIPQIFIASGASNWNEPQERPWSIGFNLSYQTEAAIEAAYALKEKPDAKIAVLYQNDDLGKDYLIGLKKALGPKAATSIVKEASYEVTDPTLDSQIVTLRASGADVLFTFGTNKYAALAIRKVYDLGWKPLMFVPVIGNSVATAIKPAGKEKAVGVITATFAKDPTDPQWQHDAGVKQWNAWMDKYLPNADKSDAGYVFATIAGAMLVATLQHCGDDLSRANIMRQALSLHDIGAPMLLPGVTINTSPDDHRPFKQLELERFDGEKWALFGGILSTR